MQHDRSDRNDIKLTLYIYMQSLTRVVTRGRSVVDVGTLSIGSIATREDEVQTILEKFYGEAGIEKFDVKTVDLVFVNSIFHITPSGTVEAYKNRFAAYLLFHKTYFNVPVTHDHIATRLSFELLENQHIQKDPLLWFHLRHHHLFVSFETPNRDYSINSFEVRKAIDVYYYILFNVETLRTILPGLGTIVISGELVKLDKFCNFIEENLPDLELKTYWEWKGLLGRTPLDLNPFLPEVKIQ